MRRKSLLLGVVVLLLLAGTAACLGAMARHVPRFYVKATMPPGKDRKLRSAQFLQDFNQFCEEVRASRAWRGHFEQDCVNSFFQEHFIESGLHQRLLPEGIREPRISFQNDRIRFGFRYGAEPFSAVISIDMRLWLAAKAPNVVALELEGLHAGALPFSAQSLLDRASESAMQSGINVSWYRHGGNPVALLRFQANRDRPTIQLEQLILRPGIMEVQGRSLDTSAPPSKLDSAETNTEGK